MKCKIVPALTVCGALFLMVPVGGHHAVASQYDMNKPIEFEGALVQTEFVNPHSMLHLEVTNPDGTKTVWKFQSGAIGTLRRLGLIRSSADGGLKVGDRVTATGYAARNGAPMGFLRTLKMPDGRVIQTWFGDPNGN
jgi:hypothetical protein